MIAPRARLLLACLALGATAFLGTGRAIAQEPALAELITDRLALMQDVAAWKYLHALPVEDLPREAAVLEAMAAQATSLGLDPAPLVAFSAAQIDAAKAIQSCWFARWTDGSFPAPTEAPDLAAVIRPEILRIDAALVALVAAGQVPPTMPPPSLDCLAPQTAATLAEAALGLAGAG